MSEDAVWTQEQRNSTLVGLAVIREVHAGGPQYAASDGLQEIVDTLKKMGEPTDADGLAHILAGVANAASLLLDWIEGEAQNKATLLQAVRRSLRDFEEPDSYPTDPSWSTWDGVLRAIDKTVKGSATTD